MMKSQLNIHRDSNLCYRRIFPRLKSLLIPYFCVSAWVLLSIEGFAQTAPSEPQNQRIYPNNEGILKDSAAERQAKADASKRVNRISDQLKSPFCPGKTLLTCTSPQAYELRKEMAQMIIDGRSDQEILAALRDSFGEKLENPPQPWYTVLVPILPFVFGGLIAVWVFSSWLRGSRSSSDAEEEEATPALSEAEEERLRELMKEVD